MRRRHRRLCHVRVNVDQARRHQFPLGVQHLRCIRGRDIGLEIGDSAHADRNVHHPVDALAGVDHAPSLDEKVVLCGHETLRVGYGQSGRYCGGLQKLAAS